MKKLIEYVREAEEKKVAIGHFNISNLEGLWGIFNAARKLNVPVIIGVSEGERDFIGIKQVRALVTSLQQEFDYPIFLNADHSYSLDRVKTVVDAGFDAAIFDGAKLGTEENIAITKQCVEYAKSKNPEILIEAELGYIGTSSKILDKLPEGVTLDPESLTKPEQAKHFVEETGVDLFAPSVGNVHGMFVGGDPNLDIPRIKAIREACGVPMVLHGGSGTSDADFRAAIEAGIAIVHINTEIRVAFRDGVKQALAEHPDEVAPYKLMKPALEAVEAQVLKRLKLFSGME